MEIAIFIGIVILIVCILKHHENIMNVNTGIEIPKPELNGYDFLLLSIDNKYEAANLFIEEFDRLGSQNIPNSEALVWSIRNAIKDFKLGKIPIHIIAIKAAILMGMEMPETEDVSEIKS